MDTKTNLKHQVLCFLSILTFILVSCDNSDDYTIENAKTLDFQSFTLQVPQDWTSFPLQGTDTYYGGLTNQIDTLYFDFGYLSFGSLDNIEKTNETLSFQRLQINGVDAKIVKEKRAEELEVRYSVFLDKRDNDRLNWIFGYGLKDERLVTAIFLSHQFTP